MTVASWLNIKSKQQHIKKLRIMLFYLKFSYKFDIKERDVQHMEGKDVSFLHCFYSDPMIMLTPLVRL